MGGAYPAHNVTTELIQKVFPFSPLFRFFIFNLHLPLLSTTLPLLPLVFLAMPRYAASVPTMEIFLEME
jgi:hypothetical protein